jgi:C1A family cysteine protease
MTHKYNWRSDPFIHRFRNFHSVYPQDSLPAKVDLRSQMPPIVDQLDIGSCTANAWAYLLGYIAKLASQKKVSEPEEFNSVFAPLSRLFIYWNERVIQGTTDQDSGASLTEGMQAVQTWGVCKEVMWPYSERNEFKRPSTVAFAAGLQHKVPEGMQIAQYLNAMKSALQAGFPFVFGMSVYESFEAVDSSGFVSMPDVIHEQLMGGHALCCCGYDDEKQVFIVANSWSAAFGDKGYCYLPYAYLTDQQLSSDFWTVRI